MPAPMRKLTAGEPLAISASTFNSLVDAAQIVHAQGFRTGGGQPASTPLEPSRIRVRNTSGEDRDRGEILGIDAPAIGPADNLHQFSREIILDGVTPTADHTGRFVVLLEPLRHGQIGRAIVSGCVPVRVKLEDRGPEVVHLDRFADVLDGDCTRLRSGAHGSAQILWMEDPDEAEGGDDDTYWAIVRLGNGTPLIRKAEMIDTLQQGDASPAKAWLLKYENDEWERTEEQIELYGDQGFRGVAFGRTSEVDAGDKIDVYYSPEAQRWYGVVGGWYFHGNVVDDIEQGMQGQVRLNVGAGSDAREITVPAFSPYGKVRQDDHISVTWNTFSVHWDIGELPAPKVEPGCGLKVEEPEGEEEDENVTRLAVDPTAIAGDGLKPDEDNGDEGCALAVDDGCGLRIGGTGQLLVNNLVLAGTGLTPESECSVAVHTGCGLDIGVGGAVVVNNEALAGTGLEPQGTCGLSVRFGCGLNLGPADEIVFDAAHVAGDGLKVEDECGLAVDPGCGIWINNGKVEVAHDELTGSGLTIEDNCKIGVDATPDDNLDEILTVVTGATLSLDGCHVTLNRTTRTLTFKHNADGFIIGVELGEPQQSTSTVDVSTCCCAEPTLYELQKCGEVETSIIVAGADLTDPAMGSVHKDDNGDCWEVTAVDAEGEPTAFVEAANFPPGGDPCGDCTGPPPATLYHLRLCDDVNTQVVVSGDDLTTPEIGAVYKDANGVCWIVFDEDVAGPAQAFTEDEYYPPEGDPCATCDGPTEVFHELTLCGDVTTITVSATDLTNPELGSVHRDDSGDCWEITSTDVPGPGDPFTEAASFPPGGDPCGDCATPPAGECCDTDHQGMIGLLPVHGQIGDEVEHVE